MITKPTLIVDQNKCKKNIEMMFLKAKKNKVSFRPHFKTHQSLEIGEWFKELGIDKITVSSLEMAQYFSSEWNDITVAFPANILEIDTINQLSEKIVLHVLVESVETALYLEQNAQNNLGIFIKIDVGYHRTGIDPSKIQQIDDLLKIIDNSKTLNFKGFLGHAGHTYKTKTKEEISIIHNSSCKIMTSLKAKYHGKYSDLTVSLGDTPSCSIVDDFSGIDEIRPGNFVFYDLMQHQIGSCTLDQVSVAMACPIVSIHKERNEIVVYGGGVHFSKESLEDPHYGTYYGIVVRPDGEGWGNPISGMYVKSLSQEHGVISVPESKIENYSVGELLLVLPVHSCMTVSAIKFYNINSKTITKL